MLRASLRCAHRVRSSAVYSSGLYVSSSLAKRQFFGFCESHTVRVNIRLNATVFQRKQELFGKSVPFAIVKADCFTQSYFDAPVGTIVCIKGNYFHLVNSQDQQVILPIIPVINNRTIQLRSDSVVEEVGRLPRRLRSDIDAQLPDEVAVTLRPGTLLRLSDGLTLRTLDEACDAIMYLNPPTNLKAK